MAKPIELNPDQLLQVFEEYITTDFVGLKRATIARTRCMINKLTRWMKANHYKAIDVGCLQKFIKYLLGNVDPTSAVVYWIAVRRFLKWMERTGRIKASPHHAVKMPHASKATRIVTVTHEEYLALREAAAGHWMDWIILLGWHTGMSISDCMLLKWGNINFDGCYIEINRVKTGTKSVIPFDPSDELGRTLAVMRDSNPNPDPDDFVSPDAGYRTSSHDCLGQAGTDAFRDLADRAGLPKEKKFHGFRHTFISMLANSGMPAILASKVSGHKDFQVLSEYVHPNYDVLRKHVLEARLSSGKATEVTVKPHGRHVATGSNYLWRPNKVYAVKRGRLQLPDGQPIVFVKSGPTAEGKRAIAYPCDRYGTTTSQLQLLVDIRDVRVL